MCLTTMLHSQFHLSEIEGNCKNNLQKSKTVLLGRNKTRLSTENSESRTSLSPLSVPLLRREVKETYYQAEIFSLM